MGKTYEQTDKIYVYSVVDLRRTPFTPHAIEATFSYMMDALATGRSGASPDKPYHQQTRQGILDLDVCLAGDKRPSMHTF